MPLAHINIGSNTGHRHALIEKAVACVAQLSEGAVYLCEPVETEPWGYSSPNSYLNLAMAITLKGEVDGERAARLLRNLLDIEHALSDMPHRNDDGTYRDREIDIDLIAIGSLCVSTSGLELPHPRMHLRLWVWRGVLKLEPGWTHPLSLPLIN